MKILKPQAVQGKFQCPMKCMRVFSELLRIERKLKNEPMINGKCGFLYLDKNDMPMVALHWEKYFQHICEKYNSIYKVQMPKCYAPCMQAHFLF